MIEIIPNWHPVFVHFTIGLLSMAALFYLAGRLTGKENLLIAARWNLWAGTAITIGTVIAGFAAYYSVAHDETSHIAMVDHRNWALTTAGTFLGLACWALWKQRGAKTVAKTFVIFMLLGAGLLTITGYKGGELVYRHGTGVMRLPETGSPTTENQDQSGTHDHSQHDH